MATASATPTPAALPTRPVAGIVGDLASSLAWTPPLPSLGRTAARTGTS
jgi:hypothetical protein